jgi:hypothetical protein
MSANGAKVRVAWSPVWGGYVLAGWSPARHIDYPRTALRFVNRLNHLNSHMLTGRGDS